MWYEIATVSSLSECFSFQSKSTAGEPIPLDSDLEGFWDITYPLIDKVKEKFAKLDTRKAKQWAPMEEYDPNDSMLPRSK